MFKNFTPHEINVFSADGNILLTFPSEGAARCSQIETEVGAHEGITIVTVGFGGIFGLPEPEDGVRYIVSAIAHQAAVAAGRTDTVIPARTVRDESGRIIGCTAFAV